MKLVYEYHPDKGHSNYPVRTHSSHLSAGVGLMVWDYFRDQLGQAGCDFKFQVYSHSSPYQGIVLYEIKCQFATEADLAMCVLMYPDQGLEEEFA